MGRYKTLLSIVVQDSGAGISEGDVSKLFQPFVTLEDTRSINPNGLGLGLFVSKVICERSGGDISCFSNGLGQGSSFEFRIQVEET